MCRIEVQKVGGIEVLVKHDLFNKAIKLLQWFQAGTIVKLEHEEKCYHIWKWLEVAVPELL